MTSIMEEELKGCPFCGGEPVISFSHEVGRWDVYEVECSDCQITKWSENGLSGDTAKVSAIKAWNLRTPDTALIEKLREGLEAAVRDLANTYEAAKSGKSLAISIGQFRRLASLQILLTQTGDK